MQTKCGFSQIDNHFGLKPWFHFNLPNGINAVAIDKEPNNQ
jgi:hypothetical protein